MKTKHSFLFFVFFLYLLRFFFFYRCMNYNVEGGGSLPVCAHSFPEKNRPKQEVEETEVAAPTTNPKVKKKVHKILKNQE